MSNDTDPVIAAIEAPRATYGLVGHAAASRAFLDAFAAGRLHHAWLIGGPAGVGKATLAWRFTRHVLAAEAATPGGGQGGPPHRDPNRPDHPVSRLLAAGAHPDCRHVHRTVPSTGSGRVRTEITVEDVRALGPFLRQTPARGGWRVAIIDTADDLNVNAANALLKLLEEPPARALLLVLAHAPARLLPTIRSRCRHLALRGVPEDEMAAFIDRLAADAGAPPLDAADRATLAQLAEGRPGRAASLYHRDGLATYRLLLDLLGDLPRLDMTAVMAASNGFAGARGEPAYRTFMELLLWWLRDLVRGAAQADTMPGPPQTALGRRLIADRSQLERWLTAWESARDLAARADEANLDRKQVVLQIFTGLAAAAA